MIINELSTSCSCMGYAQMAEFVNMKYKCNVSQTLVFLEHWQ